MNNSGNTGDSREAERVSMRIPCQLSIGQASQSDVVRSRTGGSSCYMINLSDKGMQISSNMLIKEDVRLSASLSFEKEKRAVSFLFKVKWLRKNSFKTYGVYSYGLEFIEISEDERDFLHRIYDREKHNLDQKTIIEE